MNVTKTHLNDEQIITATVDATDLPETVRNHLSTCPQCSQAVDQLNEELSTAGKLAQHFSPKPTCHIQLPPGKEATPLLGSWKWRLSFGAAFSLMLAFVIMWWSGITMGPINEKFNAAEKELWEDEQLMTEISDLSQNALPEIYLDITGQTDTDTEEDFMEFIVPSNQDTSLSKIKEKKGVISC